MAASYRVCPSSKWRALARPASVRIVMVRYTVAAPMFSSRDCTLASSSSTLRCPLAEKKVSTIRSRCRVALSPRSAIQRERRSRAALLGEAGSGLRPRLLWGEARWVMVGGETEIDSQSRDLEDTALRAAVKPTRPPVSPASPARAGPRAISAVPRSPPPPEKRPSRATSPGRRARRAGRWVRRRRAAPTGRPRTGGSGGRRPLPWRARVPAGRRSASAPVRRPPPRARSAGASRGGAAPRPARPARSGRGPSRRGTSSPAPARGGTPRTPPGRRRRGPAPPRRPSAAARAPRSRSLPRRSGARSPRAARTTLAGACGRTRARRERAACVDPAARLRLRSRGSPTPRLPPRPAAAEGRGAPSKQNILFLPGSQSALTSPVASLGCPASMAATSPKARSGRGTRPVDQDRRARAELLLSLFAWHRDAPLVARSLGLSLDELYAELDDLKLRRKAYRLTRGSEFDLPLARAVPGAPSGPPVRRRARAARTQSAAADEAASTPAAADPDTASVAGGAAPPRRGARGGAVPDQAAERLGVLAKVGPRRSAL